MSSEVLRNNLRVMGMSPRQWFLAKRKRKRSDPVLWEKPQYRQKMKVKIQHKEAIKNVDYTMIADRLRAVSWSNK